MSTADTALIAARWVADHAPAEAADALTAALARNAEAGTDPWPELVGEAHILGLLDLARDLCEAALTADPDLFHLRLKLASLHVLAGDRAAAKVTMERVPLVPPLRVPALALLLENDLLPDEDQRKRAIGAWAQDLAAQSAWGEGHDRLITFLRRRGYHAFAIDFAQNWLHRHGGNADPLAAIGHILLENDQPAPARGIFENIWKGMSSTFAPIFGAFDGNIPDYTDAVDAAIAEKVERAFAVPADDLPALALAPEVDVARYRDRSTMFVGLETINDLFPNDLAVHFQASAAEAGIEMSLHLDSALVFPYFFKGSDALVAERVARFEGVLAERRPDVVILDACYHPQLRGLNPANMAALRERFGFKLVCMMRDALSGCEPILLGWIDVCDTMLVYDPLSPVVAAMPPAQRAKVVFIPIPAVNAVMRAGRGFQDLGLAFVGSVNYRPRLLFMAVLQTAGIDFTALFGEKRAAEVPDLDAYARWLGRARAVLNFSAHSQDEHLITGRVFETIAAGALLFEQDHPAAERYFTPWRHYVPWGTVTDIVHHWHFIDRHDDVRARMVAEAQAFTERHYGPERVWAAIMSHALGEG